MVNSHIITLSPDIDDRFRKCVSKRYPDERGNRKKAAEEAIKEWCDKIDAEIANGDGVSANANTNGVGA